MTKQIGDYGEDLAEKYLKKRGWRILSRNFGVKGGEIDIIAKDKNALKWALGLHQHFDNYN